MSTRADQLAHKRQLLLRRTEWQRREVAELAAAIEAKLLSVDRMLGAVGRTAKNPLVPIAVIAGLMFIGPWRVLRWVGQGMIALNVIRRVRGLLAR